MISTKLILKTFTIVSFIISQQGNEVKSEYEVQYAVIIDAGSTGSRVFEFHFIVTEGLITLVSPQRFSKTTPGLSEYLYEPAKGVQSIAYLIASAQYYFVPEEFWPTTIVSVRLTDGLRDKRSEYVDKLLGKLRTIVGKFGFESNENPVDFLIGLDEARFSWFTINYLTNRLNGDLNNTVAVIELSDGSVKIAYIPTKGSLQEENIREYVVKGQNTRMYCNCFTELGLMSGRKSTFISAEGDAVNVTSNCINENNKNIEFKFDQRIFKVSGVSTANGSIDYQSCKKSIETYVSGKLTNKPDDLKNQNVVATSFFFERAQDAGLVDEYGGTITAQELYTAAENECNKVFECTTCPYKCLDYTYNAVLLDKGFGVSHVTVLKIIDGHVIHWALGLAYELLEKKFQNRQSATNN